jgi:hypothetical protein
MTEKNNQYLHLRLIEAEDLCNLFAKEFQLLYSEKVARALAKIIVYDVVEANWTPHQKPNIKGPKNLGSISLFYFPNEMQSFITGRRTLDPQPENWFSVVEIDSLQFEFEEKRLLIPVSVCEEVFNNVENILGTNSLYVLWNDHPDTWDEL